MNFFPFKLTLKWNFHQQKREKETAGLYFTKIFFKKYKNRERVWKFFIFININYHNINVIIHKEVSMVQKIRWVGKRNIQIPFDLSIPWEASTNVSARQRQGEYHPQKRNTDKLSLKAHLRERKRERKNREKERKRELCTMLAMESVLEKKNKQSAEANLKTNSYSLYNKFIKPQQHRYF